MKLPHDIVELVTTYIRVEMREIEPPPGYGPWRIYSMYEQAIENPTKFLADLAAAVLPANGEAARGGARLVWDLLSVEHFDTDQNARAMLDAGVQWARVRHRPLVPYEAVRALPRTT